MIVRKFAFAKSIILYRNKHWNENILNANRTFSIYLRALKLLFTITSNQTLFVYKSYFILLIFHVEMRERERERCSSASIRYHKSWFKVIPTIIFVYKSYAILSVFHVEMRRERKRQRCSLAPIRYHKSRQIWMCRLVLVEEYR